MHYRIFLLLGAIFIVLSGLVACSRGSISTERTVGVVAGPRPQDVPIIVPVSDDFNACELDTDLWSFIDPYAGTVAASALLVRGYSVDITIPAGYDHDMGEMVNEPYNRSPRLTQSIADDDFEISVKFNSGIEQEGQLQGILAAQDESNFLAVTLRHDDTGYQLVARLFLDGAEVLPELAEVGLSTGKGPIYLQLARDRASWVLQYSYDGIEWSNGISFESSLSVSEVGIFGGNSGLQPPTHALSVDYFYNTVDPIQPGDAVVMFVEDLSITIDPFEQAGSVVGGPVNPVAGNPGCGNPIQLTANAAAEWEFDTWVVQGVVRADQPLVDQFGFGEAIFAQFQLIPTATSTATPTGTNTPTITPSATTTGTVEGTSTPTGTLTPMVSPESTNTPTLTPATTTPGTTTPTTTTPTTTIPTTTTPGTPIPGTITPTLVPTDTPTTDPLFEDRLFVPIYYTQ